MNLINKNFSRACLGFLTVVAAGNIFVWYEPNKKTEPKSEPVEQIGNIGAPGEITSAKIKADVARLNKGRNYNLTAEGLVALARTVYFEGSFDSQVDNNTKLLASYAGIAQVIQNRYLFDNCLNYSPLQNPNCGNDRQYLFGGEKGIEGIVRKETRGVHSFSCVDDHPHFYAKGSLDDGLNSATYFGKGKGKKTIARLSDKRLRFAYQALVSVLDGSAPGNTDGAFYYKNSSASNQVWTGDEAFMDTNNSCQNLKYKPDAKAQALIAQGSSQVHCRVGTSYKMNPTHTSNGAVLTIGGHTYYTMIPSTTETVFDDKHGNTFVNGKKKEIRKK